MEDVKSKTNSSEYNKSRHEQFLKRFFKRHLAIVLYALLAGVSQNELQAQEGEKKVETITAKADQDSLELERMDAFKKFKVLVEKEGIVEKVSKQKEIFGPAIGGFLQFRWINSDLDFLARLEKRKDEEGVFVNKKDPMVMTTGSIVAKAYKERWEYNRLTNEPTALKNVDAVPGLSSLDLQKFLDKTYPKKYIANSISEIEFIGKSDVREKEKTEILGQSESFGMNALVKSKSGDMRAPLKINLPTTGIDKESFLDILKHEVGHPNDWNNSLVLTSAERVSMLDEIYTRSVSKDRYISAYVEGITLDKLGIHFEGKTEDDKVKNQYLSYVRVNEYWAEIQKAYFTDQNKFKEEHPDDHAVVEKWVTIISK